MTEEREQVILVSPSDEPVGVAGKLDVHRDGRLHRAFSVFVVRDDGRHLLQQRALGKYHSGGRWSNACCGHPRPGERTIDAARRRLNEELGIDCELEHRTTFTYRADVGEGLLEHEIDHVFVGRHAGEPRPDPHEVAACRWAEPSAIDADLRARPDDYTAWFRPAWEALRNAAPDEEPRASHSDSSVEHERTEYPMTDTMKKTDAEWRATLSPEEYRVLREKGTERAFTGKYEHHHEPGVYRCAACGNVLFDADTKFESGSGWPSFYAAASGDAVRTEQDASMGMMRTEVLCAKCDSHLGHLFPDGPNPTGMRYCMNSISLRHEPPGDEGESK